MNEGIKLEKFSPEENKYFDELEKRYEELSQEGEYLVLNYDNGSKDYILKSAVRAGKIRTKSEGDVEFTKYLDNILSEEKVEK